MPIPSLLSRFPKDELASELSNAEAGGAKDAAENVPVPAFELSVPKLGNAKLESPVMLGGMFNKLLWDTSLEDPLGLSKSISEADVGAKELSDAVRLCAVSMAD